VNPITAAAAWPRSPGSSKPGMAIAVGSAAYAPAAIGRADVGHVYETGGLRRVHSRGHPSILEG